MKRKIELHKEICSQLADTYIRKNTDYGDAFGQSLKEHGLIASVVRMEDKFNRFKNITKHQTIKVDGETLEDTLLDLANYAIMTVIELRSKK